MLRRPRRRQNNTRPAFQPVGAGRPRARPNETRNTTPMGPRKGVVRPPGNIPGAPPVGPVGSGAPSVVPPVRGPAPRTAASEIMRANAEQGLGGAKNAYRDAVFRAAMALGDENIFAKLRSDPEFAGYQFAASPNSAMVDLARQEQEGLKTIDNTRNQGNTFFSGFRLGDRQDYTGEVNRQRLNAVGSFNDALAEYAGVLAGAQGQYNQDIGDADIYDIDYALQFDPEPGAYETSKPPAKKKPSAKKQFAKSQSQAKKAAAKAESKAKKKAKKK